MSDANSYTAKEKPLQCKVHGQLFGVGYCAHCHIGHLECRVKALQQLAGNEGIVKAAAKFRDAFKYDPGHSDLDNEQPIHITVTLGDWRKLDMTLTAQGGPASEAEAACAEMVKWCDKNDWGSVPKKLEERMRNACRATGEPS